MHVCGSHVWVLCVGARQTCVAALCTSLGGIMQGQEHLSLVLGPWPGPGGQVVKQVHVPLKNRSLSPPSLRPAGSCPDSSLSETGSDACTWPDVLPLLGTQPCSGHCGHLVGCCCEKGCGSEGTELLLQAQPPASPSALGHILSISQTRGLQVVLGGWLVRKLETNSGAGTLIVGGEFPRQHRLGGWWPGGSQSRGEGLGNKYQPGCVRGAAQPQGRSTGTWEVALSLPYPASHSGSQPGPLPSETLRAQAQPGFCNPGTSAGTRSLALRS